MVRAVLAGLRALTWYDIRRLLCGTKPGDGGFEILVCPPHRLPSAPEAAERLSMKQMYFDPATPLGRSR
jgi:hypothetical protein